MEHLDRRLIPFTVEEVAAILKVSPRIIATLLKKGELKGGKVGKEWRVLHGDLETYLHRITGSHCAEQPE